MSKKPNNPSFLLTCLISPLLDQGLFEVIQDAVLTQRDREPASNEKQTVRPLSDQRATSVESTWLRQ